MRPLMVVCCVLLLALLISTAAAAPVLYGGISFNFTPSGLFGNERIINKSAAGGYPALDAFLLVLQNPTNATATPTADKIPIADAAGTLDAWVTSTDQSWNVSYLLTDGTRNMSGVLNMSGFNISNLLNPVADQDAATKVYVDAFPLVNNSYITLSNGSYVQITNRSYVLITNSSYVLITNGSYVLVGNASYVLTDGTRTFTGKQSMGGFNLTDLLNPVANQDAATKAYVDAVGTINTSYVTLDNTSYILADGTRAMVANLSLGGYNVSRVLNPVANQDAATKTYVDTMAVINDSKYYYLDTSRALTGGFIFRDVRNAYLSIIGGNATPPYSGNLQLYGGDAVAMSGGFIMSVGNESGNSPEVVFSSLGRTDTPTLDLNANRIISLADPINAQDAATKAYVDLVNATGGTAINNSYVTVDNTSYILTSGVRPFAGKQSMGGFNLTDVLNPVADQDAATKKYVDDVNATASTNASAYSVAMNTSMKAYVDAKPAGGDTSQFLFLNGTRPMTGIFDAGGFNLSNLLNPVADQDAATKNYVDVVNNSASANASAYSTAINASLIGFATTVNLSSTNTSASANASAYSTAINASMKAYVDAHAAINTSYVQITNGSYVQITNGSYVQITNGSYVTVSNGSYVQTTNGSYVQVTNGSYVQITNTSYVKNPSYGYVSLMAGSAMVPYTSSANLSQNETPTNKVNYIYGAFIDGGSENLQWVVEMPADWNGGLVTDQYFWTAASGAGTVTWNLSTKLFPDAAALDTALDDNATASVTDTLLAVNQLHVSSESSPFTIFSAGSGGTTLIAKLTRDSALDTLSGDARIIAVRLKYIRTLV